MDELCARSATAIVRHIAARQVSSAEVVQTYLAQIARVNPRLNAVVALDAERALDAARRADEALARGAAAGPLHGLPVTVKDWIDVAGLPCTGGESQFRDRVPAEDAVAVARLRAAGAIVLGKTNVMIENSVYGRTENPYRAGYSPAGSSSGEAAIIAAGGSPLGLGSDSGGSIRQPAHACGVAGLKPTAGRVPLTGHFPFISAINDPRTVIGPLARFVDDLALALPIIAGPDGRDPSAHPAPLGRWRDVNLAALRVAWYTQHADASPSAETVAICSEVARMLAGRCARVDEVLPPRIEEALPITRAYWRRPESTSPEAWAPDGPAQLASEEVERHLFEWDRFRRALLGFMTGYDVVLTPAADLPATPHGSDAGGIPYTLPYSLTGWPAVVVRAGASPEGLPIGVQVVAAPWREDIALAVAAAVETDFGGWRPPQLS